MSLASAPAVPNNKWPPWDQLTTALSLQEEGLKLRGYDPRAIRALITVWPLLLEREAISRYLAKHPQYRHALPEVNSIQEAVILADLEYQLTTAQQKELADLLLMLESGTQPPAKAKQESKPNRGSELPKDPPRV